MFAAGETVRVAEVPDVICCVKPSDHVTLTGYPETVSDAVIVADEPAQIVVLPDTAAAGGT